MKKEVANGILIIEGNEIEEFEENDRIEKIILIGKYGNETTLLLGEDVKEKDAYKRPSSETSSEVKHG